MVTAQRTVLVAHPGAEMFGSDRMLLESVIGFLEAGARVVVALPSRGALDVELRRAGAEVVVIPMLVLRKVLLTRRGLPQLFRDTFRGSIAAWRLIGRLRPDAVYVSTIIIPQWPVIARLRRSYTVSHVHEAEASGNRLVNAMLYLPHLMSHRTLINSRFSLETLRRSLPPLAERATVVYNGVASPPEPTPPRPRLEGSLRILYIGRLSARKGPDVAIRAAGELSRAGHDVTLTLLGAVFPGYEWFEAELRALAQELSVDVTFAGFHSEIWPFLDRADVLVVPSRVDEPFGNTAVEGVLARRPIVVSDSSGLREAAGGYDTALLVPPDSPAELAQALADVVARWPEMVDRTHQGRADAQERHSPDLYRHRVAQALDPSAEAFTTR